MKEPGWHGAPTLALEDVIVALADTLWMGKRKKELARSTAEKIVQQSEEWEVLIKLDVLIEAIAADAQWRLRWH